MLANDWNLFDDLSTMQRHLYVYRMLDQTILNTIENLNTIESTRPNHREMEL